jgi:O-methyltransferase / aklanonic acid methyltransferase
MERIWSRPAGVSDLGASDYWEYFGIRLVEQAGISSGERVLDLGCGAGSSLFPALKRTTPTGFSIGIDICTS